MNLITRHTANTGMMHCNQRPSFMHSIMYPFVGQSLICIQATREMKPPNKRVLPTSEPPAGATMTN